MFLLLLLLFTCCTLFVSVFLHARTLLVSILPSIIQRLGMERASEVEYLDVVDRVSVGDQYAASCGPAGKLTLHWVVWSTLVLILSNRFSLGCLL